MSTASTASTEQQDSERSSTELFAPGAEAYYRKVLKLDEPKPALRCKCGHGRSLHGNGRGRCCSVPGTCGCQAFICDHTRCGWKPREECDHNCSCGHMQADHSTSGWCNACGNDCDDDDGHYPSDCAREQPEEPKPATRVGCAVLHQDAQGNVIPCPDEKAPSTKPLGSDSQPFCLCEHERQKHFGDRFRCHGFKCNCAEYRPEVEEPPMTPEEEEEAPEDEGLEDCICGHEPPEHEGVTHEGPCHGIDGEDSDASRCGCPGYRTKPDFELPPQPERRPPYAVAYSVQGHLYEVALPGDATVRAVDGTLVISHRLGPVSGIVQVVPMQTREGA